MNIYIDTDTNIFVDNNYYKTPIQSYTFKVNDYYPVNLFFVAGNEVVAASAYPGRQIFMGVRRVGDYEGDDYVLFVPASAVTANGYAYEMEVNVNTTEILNDLGVDNLSGNDVESVSYKMDIMWSDEVNRRTHTNIVDFVVKNTVIKDTLSVPVSTFLPSPEEWLFSQLSPGITTQNVWTNYLNAQIQADVNVLTCNSANILSLGVGYMAPIASLSAASLSSNTFKSNTISSSTISAVNINSTTLSSVSLSSGKIIISNSSTSPLVDVYNSNSSGTAIKGIAINTGNGIEGSSYAGYGVKGYASGTGYGVYASATSPSNALYVDGGIKQVPVTYATLTAYTNASNGQRAICTDSVGTTFNSTLSGGGLNTVPVFCVDVEGNFEWRVG